MGAKCVVADCVLRVTGSAVGGWPDGVIWEHVREATGWSVGVGCTLDLEAYGEGWLATLGASGDGCVVRRPSIHLFLFITSGGTSPAVDKGVPLAVGVAWAGLVVGDRFPLQALMNP